MTAKIEARPYGPDSTPEQVAALRERVSFHGDATVLYREVPVMSAFQIDVLYDRVEELFRQHDCAFMIVDVSDGGRPDGPLRAKIKQRTLRLAGKLIHVAVITHTNVLVRIAAKFVAAELPMPMSVHDTLAEAEQAIRRVSST